MKYFTSMYNIQKNSKKAIDVLEALSTNLEKRYEERNVAERIAKLDLELKNSESKSSKLDENSNENIDTPVENGIGKVDPKDYLITHKKLYSLINQKSTTFLVLDTRPSDVKLNFSKNSVLSQYFQDYQNSRMQIPYSLNVPETILRPGTTANSVGKNLKVEDRSQWERRTSMVCLGLKVLSSYASIFPGHVDYL